MSFLLVFAQVIGCTALKGSRGLPTSLTAVSQRLRQGSRSAKGTQPHKLDAAQLSEIRTVSCLKARQLSPDFDCKGSDEVTDGMLEALARRQYDDMPLGLGNFPSWRDDACHSGGQQLLCDPSGLMQEPDHNAVAATLGRFGASASVVCGKLETEMFDKNVTERRPFRFAIVVLGYESSVPEISDALTQQRFGLFVLANWDLMPTYNGIQVRPTEPRPTGNQSNRPCKTQLACPDAALLVVMPQHGRAFLSAASCEFICAERGGPQVVAAVEQSMARGDSLGHAIQAGIEAAGIVLSTTGSAPLSMVEPVLTRKWRIIHEHRQWLDDMLRSGIFWQWSQRVVLFALLAFSAFVAASFLYFNCISQGPSLRKGAQR